MRTFGVEIETVGVPRSTVAKAMSLVLKAKKSETLPDPNDPPMTFEEIHASNDAVWKVMDDDSLQAEPHLRAEIVTPVLKESDLKTLLSVIKAIAKTGAKVNASCGIHVHIGALEASVEDICRLIDIVIDEEPKLIKEFACNPNRIKNYAKPISPDFIKNFKSNRPKTDADLEVLWYGKPATKPIDRYDETRYRGLNLNSYFLRFTIEFRYFDSTLDPRMVEAYVNRCLKLVDKAKIP